MYCSSCQTENLEGAKFCQECGNALSRNCEGCGSLLPSRAKFCVECGRSVSKSVVRSYTPRHLADKILKSRSALEGERKQVTVLFADIKESMSLAETVDPESWHRILDGFFAILSDGVHRFEGTVNQYTGDGIMALFGAPIAHEDHAQRACHAALYLGERLARYSEELKRRQGLNFSVRVGINSGEVVVGSIGDDLRMDYTAQGRTVGLAARMEALAAPGSAYLTEYTAALISDYFDLRDLGLFEIKGASEPLRAYELLSAFTHKTRLDVSRARGLSRFVGRSDEMAVLESALSLTAGQGAQVVTVVAEGGAGKSRLCHEFIESLGPRGIQVYRGNCVAHGRMIPFYPILQILRSYFGIGDQDSDKQAREKIAGRLLLLDESFKDTLPFIFDFLAVPDPGRPASPMEPEPRRQLLFASVQKMFQCHSGREAEVILVEDLHWIDGASEHFLQELSALLGDARCLLVLNYRPVYEPVWLEAKHRHEVRLEPLGPEAVSELLDDLLGSDPSVSQLAANIARSTAGNPFFVEEVVVALSEAGSLEGSRGNYRLVKPVEDVILPPTVQAVLAARIDNLPPLEKQVLETAAVIGKEFGGKLLERVWEGENSDLDSGLAALETSGFVYRRGSGGSISYAFSHPLTQEVAYRAQLTERRSQLHASAAAAVCELSSGKVDEWAALAAHHWEGAGELVEAAKARRRAAVWSWSKDARESHRHWKKVVELVTQIPRPHKDPEVLELGLAATEGVIGSCWRLGLSREESSQVFAWGKALAEAGATTPGLARVLSSYATLLSFAGEVDESLSLLDQAALLTTSMSGEADVAFVLSLTSRRSFGHLLAGQLGEALRLSEKAYELAGRSDRATARVGAGDYIFLGGVRALPNIYLGHLDEAGRIIEKALAAALEQGEKVTAASIRGFGVTHAWFKGDAATAERYSQAQLEFAERLGSTTLKASAYDSCGIAAVLKGDWDTAVSSLESALELARAGGTFLQAEALMLANLAEAYLGRGDDKTALARAHEAVEVARRRRTAMHECRAALFLGRVLVRSCKGPEWCNAQEPLHDALRIVERTGAKAYEPFVRAELAELARLRGENTRWRDEVDRAARLFIEIGAPEHGRRLRPAAA